MYVVANTVTIYFATAIDKYKAKFAYASINHMLMRLLFTPMMSLYEIRFTGSYHNIL